MAELARLVIWFDCFYCRDLKELKLHLVLNQDRYALVSPVLKLNNYKFDDHGFMFYKMVESTGSLSYFTEKPTQSRG